MSKKFSYTIGFDLGGTKLASALVRSDGLIIDFIKVPVEMRKEKSPTVTQKRVVNMMADIAMDFKNRFPQFLKSPYFKGIGLASAGPLNVETGTLIYPTNYPGWKIVPIQKMTEKEIQARGFNAKVAFQNDAMAAAYAEGWTGKAKHLKSYALVTVGTGIGSGVIVNGQPCQTNGAGSEFGHIIVDYKGFLKDSENSHDYSVEGVASGTGLINRARKLGFKGNSVEELIEENNPKYDFLFDEMAGALASLCFNLSVGFHLEGIFLSGGLIKIKDLYFKSTIQSYKKLVRQFNPLFECSIEIAKTKNQAGVVGAAYLPYLKG
jgi:glucokinase